MDLKYKETPASEGGGALPGCGTIHISEIRPTLTRLSDDLEFPFDLNDYVLGSTGKKEYSGDIDVVIDDKWWGDGPQALRENLIELFGVSNVAKNGSMVHLRYPIINYDPGHNLRLPRTGVVQIDFNFGNADWERLYHHSPGGASAYKGAHRNLALAAITSSTNTDDSFERDTYGRPVEQVRWKWSPKGFIKVRRLSKIDTRSGVWMKKQQDTVVEGPYFDAGLIAKVIFPEDGTPGDLDSLETIVSAVKRNYGFTDQARIWRQMAKNFSDWRGGSNFIYLTEIEQYLPTNDK
jgi:hypothetical protein